MGENDSRRPKDQVTGSIGLHETLVCSTDKETHIGRS